MMTEHALGVPHTHTVWDNSLPAHLFIRPGDTVVFECPNAVGGQITPETRKTDLAAVDLSRLHTLVGPVYIEGAEPGDALEIDVLRMQHHGWGYSQAVPNGLLGEEMPVPDIHHWKLDDSWCYFYPNSRLRVRLRPFCGVMGVAPLEAGESRTIPPGPHGGNLDLRSLVEGARLWLPVWVRGGLFSTGDCHAAQGDGEVCGTGIEAAMTVTLRIGLKKDLGLTQARFHAPASAFQTDPQGMIGTTAHGPDLFADAQDAVRAMIDVVVSSTDLSPIEAYMLCGAALDLKISQAVNKPNFTVSAYLPKSVLGFG